MNSMSYSAGSRYSTASTRGLHIALYIRDCANLDRANAVRVPPLDPSPEFVPTAGGHAAHAAASASWPDWWAAEASAEEDLRHIRDEIVGRAWQAGSELARMVLGYFDEADAWQAERNGAAARERHERGDHRPPAIVLARRAAKEYTERTGRPLPALDLRLGVLYVRGPFHLIRGDQMLFSEELLARDPDTCVDLLVSAIGRL